MRIVSPSTAAACSSDLSKEERSSGNHESRHFRTSKPVQSNAIWGHDICATMETPRERGFSGLELNAFLGGAPAVFNSCPFRERRFINREVRYIFFLFDFHNEGLNVHTLCHKAEAISLGSPVRLARGSLNCLKR